MRGEILKIKNLEKETIPENENSEKIRRGLEANRRVLEAAGERGELIRMACHFFEEDKFWKEIFLKWKKEFWERQKEKISIPEDAVQQSKLWNTGSAPIRGEIINGFKSTGWLLNAETKTDEYGIPAPDRRKSEIIVIDRESDDNLAKLCNWARGLKENFPGTENEERRAFIIAQEVFERMGGGREEKNYGNYKKENLPKWAEKRGEEILLGEIIGDGVCRHGSPLYQVLAQEAGLESWWNRWSLTAAGYGTAEPHDDNCVFLRDGRIIIVDTLHPPAGSGKEEFRKSFGKLTYKKFMEDGGFPVVGSNRSPFSNYRDRKARFSGGWLGALGVQELLK